MPYQEYRDQAIIIEDFNSPLPVSFLLDFARSQAPAWECGLEAPAYRNTAS